MGADELATYLRKASHNTCSTRKAEEILELVKKDGETKRNYQESRDFLVVNMVQDMKRSRELIKETEGQLRQVMSQLDCKLESMDGIDIVTASQLVAEIGDINRFSNADKLARFAGIAPVRFSFGRKRERPSKRTRKSSAEQYLSQPSSPTNPSFQREQETE